MKTVYRGVVLLLVVVFNQIASSDGANIFAGLCYPFVSFSYINEQPIAVNDTFILAMGCGNYIIQENVLLNDICHPDSVVVSSISNTSDAAISHDGSGVFIVTPNADFRGEIILDYQITATYNSALKSEAKIVLYIEDDFDCDNVIDRLDIDKDNDGIVDFHDGEYEDTDGDGLANCYDIDSDNDGITDYLEWQTESEPIKLLLCDENGDGWDDAFDSNLGGNYYAQVDTDMDGTPDFLDEDSDNDGVSDFIEAFDINNNGQPTITLRNRDDDQDGLDNACDTIARQATKLNAMGSCSPLPDHNNNGIRDWREEQYIEIDNEEDIPSALNPDLKLICYPNPCKERCTILLPELDDSNSAPYSLSIFDTKGNRVHLELLFQTEKELSLQEFTNGLYFVRVQMGAQTLNHKLVKNQ